MFASGGDHLPGHGAQPPGLDDEDRRSSQSPTALQPVASTSAADGHYGRSVGAGISHFLHTLRRKESVVDIGGPTSPHDDKGGDGGGSGKKPKRRHSHRGHSFNTLIKGTPGPTSPEAAMERDRSGHGGTHGLVPPPPPPPAPAEPSAAERRDALSLEALQHFVSLVPALLVDDVMNAGRKYRAFDEHVALLNLGSASKALQPCMDAFQGAVMVADVKGFTRLTEELAQVGKGLLAGLGALAVGCSYVKRG